MDPIPSYNLLQAIDPTKIKVPISDRKFQKQNSKFNFRI